LPRLTRENLGIGNEIAMNGGGEFDRDLDGPVIL
jgi:hypothetical protein